MNQACEEIDRMLRRAQLVRRAELTWEWWVIVVSALYFIGRVLPWLLAGCPVVAQ